jgi:hypothetical protein
LQEGIPVYLTDSPLKPRGEKFILQDHKVDVIPMSAKKGIDI